MYVCYVRGEIGKVSTYCLHCDKLCQLLFVGHNGIVPSSKSLRSLLNTEGWLANGTTVSITDLAGKGRPTPLSLVGSLDGFLGVRNSHVRNLCPEKQIIFSEI